MAILESCLAVLGAASQVASLHGWMSGLKAGNHFEKTLKELRRSRFAIERLSDRILYAPSIQEVHYASGKVPAMHSDPRQLLTYLTPIQQSLNKQILSTAAIPAPPKLNREFRQNPWNVLVEITPINRFRRPANPSLVPIVFFDGNTHYVGWQTHGILRSSLGCEYKSRPVGTDLDNALPASDSYLVETIHTPIVTQEYHTDKAKGIYVNPYMDDELLNSFISSVAKKGAIKIPAEEVLLLFCDRIIKKAGLFSKVRANMIGITSTSILWNYGSPTELKISGIESFQMAMACSDQDKGARRFIKKYLIGGGEFLFTLKGKQQYAVGFSNEKGASILNSVLLKFIRSGAG